MIVKFKKLSEGSIIPTWGHDDDSNAGIDFYSPIDVLMMGHTDATINLMIAWEPGYLDPVGGFYPKMKPAMIIKGRSGLSVKYGIECCNAGVIDSSYRGSIVIRLYNMCGIPYTINKGDRIAQGVVILVPVIEVREVSELSSTTRGDKGLGSSGK